jgi:hypothetical protein
MALRTYRVKSPLSQEDWSDARGAAGFISATCQLLIPVIRDADPELIRGVRDLESAAVAFAKLPTLDEHAGPDISARYWCADAVRKRLRPFVDDAFMRCSDNRCRDCEGAACTYCGGTGYAGEKRAPHVHAVRAVITGAGFIQAGATANPGDLNWRRREQEERLAIVALETEQAGIPKDQLRRQEWVWRFFACGGRMPLSESLLLAFQAAWEIGHHDFARSIARQGFGALTSEQAARLAE